jgi:AraC-like DNA-binding protein
VLVAMPKQEPLQHFDRGFGFTAQYGLKQPMPFDHTHGELEVNYVYSGALGYFFGGRHLQIPERSLAAFWAGVPHHVEQVDPSTEFMVLHVPLCTLLRWSLGTSFMRKILAGEVIVDPSSPAWDTELTQRWVNDLSGADPVLRRTCEIEIEARLRRLAHSRQHRTAPRMMERTQRNKVEAITAFLADHYRDELSTAQVGAAVGLHPNYAMSLFRRECGMSIWQYLIRLRLSHAQLLLLSTDQTVLDVALASGFGSLARFYAAFTRVCGMSPGEYRRLAR